MTPRHLVLAIAAVSVLAMGVYLFIQVRSTPAQAEGQPVVEQPRASPSPPAPSSDEPAPKWQPGPHPAPGSTTPIVHEPAVRPASHDPAEPPADEAKANPRLDAVMDQANKAYDRQDFDEAKAIAGKVLIKQPESIRMLRIMVSASCQDGDATTAQTYYEKLPKPDREQMKQRCDRFGVSFKDPPQ